MSDKKFTSKETSLSLINKQITMKSLAITDLPTKFAWISDDHERDVGEYIRYNFDTEVYKERFKVYLKNYRKIKGEKRRRLYVVMIHQLYLELLEYTIMLVKSPEYPMSHLPIMMGSVFPKDIRYLAKSYLEHTSTQLSNDKTNVISPIIPLARTISSWLISEEADKDDITAALFLIVRNCMSDYIDPYYENIYNSMKHGNRGLGMGDNSFKIFDSQDGNQIFSLESSYAYRHPHLRRFKSEKLNGLQPCSIERVLSNFDPEQIISRTEIVISLCEMVHHYYRSQIDKTKEKMVRVYSLNEVQKAWSDISKNGHTVDNYISEIHFDQENNSAEATMTIGVRFRSFDLEHKAE